MKIDKQTKLLLKQLELLQKEEKEFKLDMKRRLDDLYKELNGSRISDHLTLYLAEVNSGGKKYFKWNLRITGSGNTLKNKKVCYIGADPCVFESKLKDWLKNKPKQRKVLPEWA